MTAEGVTTRASQRAVAFRAMADRYRALALRLGEPGATGAGAATGGTDPGAGAPVLTGADCPDVTDPYDPRNPYRIRPTVPGWPGWAGRPYGGGW